MEVGSSSIYHSVIQSPLGPLALEATDRALRGVRFHSEASGHLRETRGTEGNDVLRQASLQLSEYFAGTRIHFDLPLDPRGTSFQLRVWEALQAIPYGSTVTYHEQSKKLGDANAIRAVGTANGKNPLPILIPCHRVIGTNNNLVGYAGGIERKRWLLQHEGAILL